MQGKLPCGVPPSDTTTVTYALKYTMRLPRGKLLVKLGYETGDLRDVNIVSIGQTHRIILSTKNLVYSAA